jgi:hypothetical protein
MPQALAKPPVAVMLLQVAAGAEEVIQSIRVVDQLQDALADTVSESTPNPAAGPILSKLAAATPRIATSPRWATPKWDLRKAVFQQPIRPACMYVVPCNASQLH